MTYPYQGEYAERLLAEGEAKGKLEGRIEGKIEGKIEGRAQDVLDVLDRRGIAVSERVRERVFGCQDLDRLHDWLMRAVEVESAEQIFE